MTETFISKIIDKIDCITDEKPVFDDMLIVLPNRRAHRRLLEELASRHRGESFFAPTVFPMDEFVSFLSPLKTIDSTIQILRLHQATRDIDNDRCALENLQSWCTPFLRDISDMDMQLQDVGNILETYADSAKFEISLGKDDMSETDKKKILFNELLSEIYVRFRNILFENSEAYTGMQYRDCAENIHEYAKKISHKHAVFAGFYALSPSELRIIKYIKDNFHTEIYFDVDPFYCQTSNKSEIPRQTSFFLKRDCEYLGLDIDKIDFWSNNFREQEKHVEILSTSKKMRQVYAAIDAVRNIADEKKSKSGDVDSEFVDMSDTAVVLADESLLVPFLSSYNLDNVPYNVTMEIPFKTTPFNALLQSVVSLYENAMLLTSEKDGELLFNGADVKLLFENKYLKDCFGETTDVFPVIVAAADMPHKELFQTFAKDDVGRQLPSILVSLCETLRPHILEKNDEILSKNAEKLLKTLQQEFDYAFLEKQKVDFMFSKLLVSNTLDRLNISMVSTPKGALQVMGLLETRMLDFENIILVSANEGVLPKGITYDSLLPFDFKYKFDGKDALANYLYQDQVYAYHFFRLLQRASSIKLIYNTNSDDKLAEISRFVSQMIYEAKINQLSNMVFTYNFCDFDLKMSGYMPVSIPKSDEMIEKMSKLSFSASSLKNYILCPVKFFFQNVAKIEQPAPLTDEIAANEIGNVVHGIFSEVFNQMIDDEGRFRHREIIDKHLANVSEDVKKAIRSLKGREKITDEQFNQGAWQINRHLIEENVKNYLERAKEELDDESVRILGNELNYSACFVFPNPESADNSIAVRLYGIFDRIQQKGEYIEILDYKTGKVDEAKLSVPALKQSERAAGLTEEDVFFKSVFSNPDYEKLFQLFFYTFLYSRSADRRELPVRVGIISNRKVNQGADDYILFGNVRENMNLFESIEVFEDGLRTILMEIFDKEIPFTCTEKTNYCKFCDYSAICNIKVVR